MEYRVITTGAQPPITPVQVIPEPVLKELARLREESDAALELMFSRSGAGTPLWMYMIGGQDIAKRKVAIVVADKQQRDFIAEHQRRLSEENHLEIDVPVTATIAETHALEGITDLYLDFSGAENAPFDEVIRGSLPTTVTSLTLVTTPLGDAFDVPKVFDDAMMLIACRPRGTQVQYDVRRMDQDDTRTIVIALGETTEA